MSRLQSKNQTVIIEKLKGIRNNLLNKPYIYYLKRLIDKDLYGHTINYYLNKRKLKN